MASLTRLTPRGRARLAGIFEFLEGAASSSGQVFLLGSLVVSGDAAATVHNLLTHEVLFRWGFLVSIAGVFFHLAWALLMYQLLRIVDRTIAALAVFVVLICCAMQTVTAFFYLAPLLAIQSGLGAEQASSLASVFLKLNAAAFQMDLVFFGLWCVLTGYLIFRSTFLPRVLGVLLMADGVGWALFAWPPLANHVFPAIAAVSGLAEIPLQAWLIVFGANSRRWHEQATASEMQLQVEVA